MNRFRQMTSGGLYLLATLAVFSCSGQKTANTTTPKPQVEVIEVRVSASENDAEEDTTGDVDLVSGYLELGQAQTEHLVGLRFNELLIPQGADIKRAYLQFQTIKSDSDKALLSLYGGIGAQTFSKTSRNISSRVQTSARVTWSPPPWLKIGEVGPNQRTPDITSIVQEIVERPDWDSGSPLVVILTGSGRRVASAFDRDPATAPLLHVEYSVDDSITIDHFGVEPKSANVGQPLAFSWSVSAPATKLLSCSLDVDDNGVTDYKSDDCQTEMLQAHALTAPGHYLAELQVKGDSGVSRTATVPFTVTTPESVVVIATGDMVCDPESPLFNGGEGTDTQCHMKATSELALQAKPDAVAVLGDAQYEDGQLWKFKEAYDPSWGRVKDVTYPAVGNHEYLTPGAAGYFTYFGAAAGDPAKGYYSYDLGTWHVVVLNSNCTETDGCGSRSPQLAWLKQDLASHPTKCTLAYWHQPLFSSGRIGSIDHTKEFWQALYEAGAEIVLAGHDHNYERFAPQTATGELDRERGIREFVVGNGGKNLIDIPRVIANSEVQNSGSYGVLKLTLHPESYDWEFLAETEGTFADMGSDTCH